MVENRNPQMGDSPSGNAGHRQRRLYQVWRGGNVRFCLNFYFVLVFISQYWIFDNDHLIECLVTIQSLFEFAVFFFLSANVNLLVLFEMSVGGFKPSTLPPLPFNVLLCLSFNYVLLKKLFFILGPPFCWLVKDVFST